MKRWMCALAVLTSCATAQAGLFGGGSSQPANPQGPGPEMSVLMKSHAGTADTETTIQPKKGKSQTIKGSYAALDGKIRMEMDMGQMEGIDAKSAESMKQMGMDRMVTIVLPEKKTTLLVYPGMQAYCEMPHDAGKEGKAEGAPKIDRKELGKETLDGHPCVKTAVTVTPAGGKPVEMTVWEATDLKNFPIQTQMVQDGTTVTHRFKNVKAGKPAASLFDPPAGYTKHDSVQSMMMGAAMKQMGR